MVLDATCFVLFLLKIALMDLNFSETDKVTYTIATGNRIKSEGNTVDTN